jgi:hypothetical protein
MIAVLADFIIQSFKKGNIHAQRAETRFQPHHLKF